MELDSLLLGGACETEGICSKTRIVEVLLALEPVDLLYRLIQFLLLPLSRLRLPEREDHHLEDLHVDDHHEAVALVLQ